MGIEAPKRIVRWIHCPLNSAIEIVLLSKGETWWSHWTKQGSKRCVGQGCIMCAQGREAEPRYVYGCEDERGHAFVEFGSAQYLLLLALEEEGAVGARVRMQRERPRKNSLVLVSCVGHDASAVAEDISGFVKSLGR